MIFLGLYFSIGLLFQMSNQSLWKKQNNVLQEQASNISALKKEISKQSEIDAAVQLSISEKIQSLKGNATALAKQLENQKHKNAELQTIIRYMKGKMEKDKLQEATHRNDINYDSLTSLESKYKKYEYDLSQINGKVNRLSENVEAKRLKINQNRMERVIDSGIFRNIEKELADSQLSFKKLLIENIKYQTQYQRLLTEYNAMKQKADSYMNEQKESVKSVKSKNTNSHNESFVNFSEEAKARESISKKFTVLPGKVLSHHKSLSLRNINGQSEIEDEQQIIAIRKLLSDSRLQSSQDLLYYFLNIDQVNQKYFGQINKMIDESNQLQRKIGQIEKNIVTQKCKYYPPQKQMNKQKTKIVKCQQIKQKVKEVKQIIQKETNQLINLLKQQNFDKLTIIKDQAKDTKTGQQKFEELTNILKQLQTTVQDVTVNFRKQSNGQTSRTAKQQQLEDMINKVRRPQQCSKIMKKEQFHQEYKRVLKNSASQRGLIHKPIVTKKSLGFLRR